MCACDWGPNNGGACWEICNWSCCSCYCCCCWFCCGLCTMSKFYASSVKQHCAIINHCLPVWMFGFCFAVATRHNMRKTRGIGDTESVAGWIGDCCLLYWCGPCAMCQQLRAAEPTDWDWLHELNTHGLQFIVDPCVVAL